MVYYARGVHSNVRTWGYNYRWRTEERLGGKKEVRGRGKKGCKGGVRGINKK